ncbi:MAG: preprotein translocase subunit SecG, partial [Candidatus Omnitrophota bacterium]
MYAFLIVIHVIVSLVLILVILLQAGRGGGLSESFGFSSTQTLFGTSATEFLQKATSICAIVFLLTCLSLAALSTKRSR